MSCLYTSDRVKYCLMLMNGRGVNKNVVEESRYFEKAVALGDPDAKTHLAEATRRLAAGEA